MISVLLAARGSGIDNAKFILVSFALHCFLLAAFWLRDDVKHINTALPMSISLSNVAIEENKASQPQKQPQKQKPKENAKPLPKQDIQKNVLPIKQAENNTKSVTEPVVKQENAPAAASNMKTDEHKSVEPKQEKETPASYTADYLKNPIPPYPSISRRLGETGTVMLKVQVMPDGTAGHVQLGKSSGFHRLDECAMRAVKNWRFAPAKRGNVSIVSWVNVPVDFNLEKGA